MSLAPSRSLCFIAFMAGALTLGASFYLEFGASLRPCFLCQMQRIFLAAFTLINLVAALHNPKRPIFNLYWLASMGCALFGAVTAARQVLLQKAALDQAADCWPSLHSMIDNLSLWQALQSTVKGTVDCVEINWTLFDLSLPEWSLLFFLGMLILGGMQFSPLLPGHRLRSARR
ncbi:MULTISPECIES: disulfide bond formation protein B [Pseudomonas]|uniref:disulfide bond formation protein B n=1 Tax=Pseudomonas TaxID=286 RepID=UPI000CFB69E2|nr:MULTISPECIES: disulfide bond formation protein B [Pseudomonas]PQZ94243.1 disulfide bond formation protein B [Pseudomonas trivialis]PRB29297.1 disulfide bond formation protein B [Pseudomonas sp. MYb60]